MLPLAPVRAAPAEVLTREPGRARLRRVRRAADVGGGVPALVLRAVEGAGLEGGHLLQPPAGGHRAGGVAVAGRGAALGDWRWAACSSSRACGSPRARAMMPARGGAPRLERSPDTQRAASRLMELLAARWWATASVPVGVPLGDVLLRGLRGRPRARGAGLGRRLLLATGGGGWILVVRVIPAARPSAVTAGSDFGLRGGGSTRGGGSATSAGGLRVLGSLGSPASGARRGRAEAAGARAPRPSRTTGASRVSRRSSRASGPGRRRAEFLAPGPARSGGVIDARAMPRGAGLYGPSIPKRRPRRRTSPLLDFGGLAASSCSSGARAGLRGSAPVVPPR